MYTSCPLSHRVWVVTVALFLMSCTKPYVRPVIPENAASFIGLIEGVEQSNSKSIDVILVHGMCTHDAKWVVETTDALLKAMSIRRDLVIGDFQKGTPGNGEIEVYRLDGFVGDREMRVHAVLWSPITASAKRKLCYDQTTKSDTCKEQGEDTPHNTYPYNRARLNQIFKDKILDDCLSDVMIYAGEMGATMQSQMMEAVLYSMGHASADKSREGLVTAAANEQAPLFIITESLGSKILFDALNRMRCDAQLEAVAMRTVSRTVEVFMEANQLPILGLTQSDGNSRSPCATIRKSSEAQSAGGRIELSRDSLADLTEAFNTQRSEAMTQALGAAYDQPLTMIAFSDPNDVLSFGLGRSEIGKRGRYRIADVAVSNPWTWFGLAANPLAAHLDYPANAAVRHLIVCGYPERKACTRGR